MPLLLPIVCFLLCLACAAQADEVRLVTGNDYAPFTGHDLLGGGIVTRIVMAAWAEQQHTPELLWLPWARGFEETRKGRFDATFPYVRSAQREAAFVYSEPVYELRQFVFSRAGERFEVDALDQLKGKRFCYPLGWQPPKPLQQLIELGLLFTHRPNGLGECARLLLLNRDDFFVADLTLGETALRISGAARADFQRSHSHFPPITLHLISSRRHPQAQQLIDQFNQGLLKLQQRGAYNQLLEGSLD